MTILLNRMTDTDYENYLSFAIPDYANDKIEAGTWKAEDALLLSQKSFATLLPKGNNSENEFLFTIFDEKIVKSIGYLWIHFASGEESNKFFIYDFLIFKEFRNKGYGKKALSCIDEKAKKMNVGEIGLHVFAHNKAAIHLYELVGFQQTDITMSKKV